MERGFDGAVSPWDSTTTMSPLQPNYSCTKVQGALEHLACIDLIQLCNEAKVEHCRATRDLRSCGRWVKTVLNSCGHASLCEECCQRCDICPICRISIPKHGDRFRLRLYSECIEAGLISKRCDDRFQEKEDGKNQQTADVQRLYSLFDVAMDNNLVSLICHYVTDVCMDESAVSSDPVVAILLDEVVVKDWCKRTFKNITTELQGIYDLRVQGTEKRLSSLLKFSVKLAGISNVLEVLESALEGSLSAQLHDLHQLQESVLKTKQHMEMMIWCIRNEFLENVRSRHTNFKAWHSVVRERKAAAIKRSWPDSVNNPSGSNRQDGPTLFIEDALSNLDIEQGYASEIEESEIASLQKGGGSSFLRSKIEGMVGCYPFENLRDAIDVLFLRGNSDLVVAKQAIFLYYLFDRHWTLPNENWRYIIDDFAATFSITRHSLLESFAFYLLDDHTDEALQEACRLLPEISSPTTHPKVAQVLLERQNPDAALMVLRWSGRDGGAQLVSLGEAVTTVRVQVECALLTEAFMYQRMLCTKVKDKVMRHESSQDAPDELKYSIWVESLVTEVCCLCIRRNLVDRMIELPWNSDEEKHLHKCLSDFATDDPLTNIGSLLVVFYLQRYRYIEAYQVDRKLQSVEQDFVSKNSVSDEVLFRMRSASHWRAELVDNSIKLLPDVQQQQVKTGKLPQLFSPGNEASAPEKSNLPKIQEPIFTSLLAPFSIDSSSVHVDNATRSSKPFVTETPSKLNGPLNIPHFKFSNYGSPSAPRMNIFNNEERGLKSQNAINRNLKFDDITTPAPHRGSPFKEFDRSSSRVFSSGHLQEDRLNSLSPEKEQNGFNNLLLNATPYSRRVEVNPVTSLGNSPGVLKDSTQRTHLKVHGKYGPADRMTMPQNMAPSGHLMDISLSHEEKGVSVEDMKANGGPRWRSDDTSEDEEESSNTLTGVASHTKSFKKRNIRRSRLARR